MGRVKFQIKRIENTATRQVTFSKRRNGLIKKAYEISVLCDVDVALIMFSPSGRLNLFSGNKSVEEILDRYVNLPGIERGRQHNQEFLQRVLRMLRREADITYQATSSISSTDSDQLELQEIQQEIVCFKSQLEEMENRLRIFEGDLSETTTLHEAEYRQQILEETLKRLHVRKQVLEKYDSSNTLQVHEPPDTTNIIGSDELVAGSSPHNILADWFPQKDPQVQILNFLNANGLLPMRDQAHSRLQGQNTNLISAVQRPELGQVIDVNFSPWNELYPTDDEGSVFKPERKWDCNGNEEGGDSQKDPK